MDCVLAKAWNTENVLIAAHRGGYETDRADGAPENSVANITVCARQGYSIFETDIQRTKDGQFVIVHDPTIERETTGTGKVSELDLAELKSLHKTFRDGTASSERVATLTEFLQAGKGLTVFKADLKPGVSAHFKAIMAVVKSERATDQIIFRVPYAEADLFAGYAAAGAVPVRSLLMFKVKQKREVDDVIARFDPLTVEISLSKTNPANPRSLKLIRYATSKGLLVETHAYGDAEDWAKLKKAGVRMFHTPKPSKVQRFLQRPAR